MGRVHLDFTEIRDFESIKTRLLMLFQDSLQEVKCVNVTIHPKGVARGNMERQQETTNEGEDLNDFAGMIAESIVEYVNGKDGRLFSGATVVIPDAPLRPGSRG